MQEYNLEPPNLFADDMEDGEVDVENDPAEEFSHLAIYEA